MYRHVFYVESFVSLAVSIRWQEFSDVTYSGFFVPVQQLGKSKSDHTEANSVVQRGCKFLLKPVAFYVSFHTVVKLVPLTEKLRLVAPCEGYLVVLAVVVERTVDEYRPMNKSEIKEIEQSVLRADNFCIDKFKVIISMYCKKRFKKDPDFYV